MPTPISSAVDVELRQIAERAANQYPDALLRKHGWTRKGFIDAIQSRLRNKYRHMRDTGQLFRAPDGQIRLTADMVTRPSDFATSLGCEAQKPDSLCGTYGTTHQCEDGDHLHHGPHQCACGHVWMEGR
jgi:hypothetical protein